ncbi:phosphoglycerate mutase family protein [Mycobacterium cookii]|uniref:phosphoglycerate mutase family protein n=1 Tax=Mycobacterium cookii TaxID=1775 RepID=UPI0013D4A9F1|nr:phosphoglycerate mutase family protein [Mycobacterium cookii]MCV7330719.1 phosphoglycerate mutase family protein [Mycobacterium cookii]
MSTGLMCTASALAWADDGSIVLDLVRHGESTANAAGIIDTVPPGANLDVAGGIQADTVAGLIQGEYGNSIANVVASEEVRAVQTAAPLADLLHISNPVEQLSGLNEIPAGAFEGAQTNSLEGILYLLGPLSWAFGLDLVPDLGDPSVNGVTFDEAFNSAVQTIYSATDVAGAGTPADVAFSSEGAIAVWTLMNVKNPDFSVLLQDLAKTGGLLSNGGQVVVQGDPTDGWTLVSYDGMTVPQDPGLGTELFVDVRNLFEAPQFAGYDIYEALLTGNSATIDSAIQAGAGQIDTAVAQFPVEVFDQIVTALGGTV